MGSRFGSDKFFKHGHRPGAPFFERGGIKFAILDLLKERPRHGYDIILEMERRSGGFYSPSPGAVYPTLEALEDQDLVRHTVEEGKKVYSITEAGLAFLEEHEERVVRHRERWAGHWGTWEADRPRGEIMRSQAAMRELVGRLTEVIREAVANPDKLAEIQQVLEEAVAKVTAIARR